MKRRLGLIDKNNRVRIKKAISEKGVKPGQVDLALGGERDSSYDLIVMRLALLAAAVSECPQQTTPP
jgi:hypothetical protein